MGSWGVVVSEFSVAWGKRGGGGQGREGVQLPDSLMYEAVLQSAGPRLETVVGQQSEEEGAQHTSLGTPVFSVMVLDVLMPTRTA